VNEAIAPTARQDASERLQCFHCGDPLPRHAEFSVVIDGASRPMCCAGCQAVAELICSGGLSQFYAQRTDWSARPDADEHSDALRVYDDATFCDSFVSRTDEGHNSARLLLGQMSCAACSWLVEHILMRLPGVARATVKFGDHSLTVVFDPDTLRLSTIVAAITGLGYTVRPYVRSAQREQAQREQRRLLLQMGVAGIGMMQSMMFAIALYAGDFQGIAIEHRDLLRWSSAIVTTVVMLVSSRVFFSNAWRHLQHGALVMDLPVALGIGLAYVASLYATATGHGDVYFDSVTMLTFLLLLGRYVEQRVRQRHAIEYVDAEAELPLEVQVWQNQRWQIQPRKSVGSGTRFLVQRGAMIPLDGRLSTGSSAIDESTFSGEHMPRKVTTGDPVFAGTINLEDSIEVNASGSYLETRLLALQRSIEHADRIRPQVRYLVDRIAGGFIATILIICAVAGLVWWQIDPARAVWICMAILVVSCPCALSLATPTALTAAATALRRSGILVHGEQGLESLAGIDHLLFDKTGTLTSGVFSIAELRPAPGHSEETLLALAAALQQHSNHPVARAFTDLTGDIEITLTAAVTGAGVAGVDTEGCEVRIGSDTFCRAIAGDLAPHPADDRYWVAVVRQDRALGWIGLHDPIRPEAREVVAAAERAGLKVGLLTGDSSPLGREIAARLDIRRVHTGCSPDEKVAHIRGLQAGGARVAMVGDGLNDAPVLRAADASIAVADATALAKAQADFVSSRPSLWAVIDTWRMARRCRGIIRQNILWSLSYNLVGVPLAAFGFVPPIVAAIGMSLSSLLVVGNAARLNRRPASSR